MSVLGDGHEERGRCAFELDEIHRAAKELGESGDRLPVPATAHGVDIEIDVRVRGELGGDERAEGPDARGAIVGPQDASSLGEEGSRARGPLPALRLGAGDASAEAIDVALEARIHGRSIPYPHTRVTAPNAAVDFAATVADNAGVSMSNRFVEVPADLSAIETRSEREVDPTPLGVEPAAVERIWGAVRRLYRTRTQPAITLAIRRRGELVLERAIGHARAGELATPRTPFCTFSVSKAVTAVVMHVLDERDVLRLDDPVTEYLPEFGRHGKDWVTLRHVLTHRAGIPAVTGRGTPTLEQSLALLTDPEGVIEALCDERPVFLPGRRLAYHAVTGGFVLGEVVRRATGRGIEALLAEEIARPLGMDHLSYGVARGQERVVAENTFTGFDVPFPASRVIKKALGMSLPEAAIASNDPRWVTGVVPSGNVMATADDLARFFQMLLQGGELEGHRVMQARTVRRLRVESAYLEPDLTLGLAVRYGQGVMLGSYPLSLFGPNTPHAFGHYGLVTIVAWADPERDMAAALLTSGKGVMAHQLPPFFMVLRAISQGIPKVRVL